MEYLTTQQRTLPIQGAYNVRDLGGYKTDAGKTVKWGKVIRSGDLDKLTDADLAYFEQIQIRTYIDFRDSAEISSAPDKIPSSLLYSYNLSVSAGSMIDLFNFSSDNTGKIMEEVNKFFVTEAQTSFKDFFHILMNEENAPLLFHCSAGKDRTGYAAAMFLSALGVERQTIVQDYLLSAECLKDKYAPIIHIYPQLEPLMTVKKEYIEAAFDTIDTEYGGVETYLTNNLEVDLEKMKTIYTE